MHHANQFLDLLVDAYLLGDFLMVQDFKNSIIGEIIQVLQYSDQMPLCEIDFIIETTTPNDALRRLFVDSLFSSLSSTTLEETIKEGIFSNSTVQEITTWRDRNRVYVPWALDERQCYTHPGAQQGYTCNNWSGAGLQTWRLSSTWNL